MQAYFVFFSKKGAKTLKNISPFLTLTKKDGGSMRSAVLYQGVVGHLRPE